MERMEVAVMQGYLDARVPGHLAERQRQRERRAVSRPSRPSMPNLIAEIEKQHPALASSVVRSPSPDGPLAMGYV